MSTTNEITIAVSPEVAEAYRQANADEREQIRLKVAAIVQLETGQETDRQKSLAALRQRMTDISQEAQARGLTPDILESILHDDP